jgi:hypothetical protein
MAIPSEPAITEMEKLIQARQTKNGITGPRPPDAPSHVETNVGSRDDFVFLSQQADDVEQLRLLESTVRLANFPEDRQFRCLAWRGSGARTEPK